MSKAKKCDTFNYRNTWSVSKNKIEPDIGIGPKRVFYKSLRLSGLIVFQGNSNAIAEAVEYLEENPDARPQIEKNARKRIESHFQIEKTVEEICRLYEQLC